MSKIKYRLIALLISQRYFQSFTFYSTDLGLVNHMCIDVGIEGTDNMRGFITEWKP